MERPSSASNSIKSERVITYLYEDVHERSASPVNSIAQSNNLKGSKVSKWASSPVSSRHSPLPSPSSPSLPSFPLSKRPSENDQINARGSISPSPSAIDFQNCNDKFASLQSLALKKQECFSTTTTTSRQATIDSGWSGWSNAIPSPSLTSSGPQAANGSQTDKQIKTEEDASPSSSEVFVYPAELQSDCIIEEKIYNSSYDAPLPESSSIIACSTTVAATVAAEKSDAWLSWKPSIQSEQEGRQAYEHRSQLFHTGGTSSARPSGNTLPPTSEPGHQRPPVGASKSKWSNSVLQRQQQQTPGTEDSEGVRVASSSEMIRAQAPSQVIAACESELCTSADMVDKEARDDPWASWKPTSSGMKGNDAYLTRFLQSRQQQHHNSHRPPTPMKHQHSSSSSSSQAPPPLYRPTSSQSYITVADNGGDNATTSASMSSHSESNIGDILPTQSQLQQPIVDKSSSADKAPVIEEDDWARWKAEPAKDLGGLDAFRRRQAMTADVAKNPESSQRQEARSNGTTNSSAPAERLPMPPAAGPRGPLSGVTPQNAIAPLKMVSPTPDSTSENADAENSASSKPIGVQPTGAKAEAEAVDEWSNWSATAQKDQGGAEAYRQRSAMGRGERVASTTVVNTPVSGRSQGPSAVQPPVPALNTLSKTAAKRTRQRAAKALEESSAQRLAQQQKQQAAQQAAAAAIAKRAKAKQVAQQQQQQQQARAQAQAQSKGQQTGGSVKPTTGFPIGSPLDIIARQSLPQVHDQPDVAARKAFAALAQIDGALNAVRQRTIYHILSNQLTQSPIQNTKDLPDPACLPVPTKVLDTASSVLDALSGMKISDDTAPAIKDQAERHTCSKQNKIDIVGASSKAVELQNAENPSIVVEQLIDLSLIDDQPTYESSDQRLKVRSQQMPTSSLLDLEGLEFSVGKVDGVNMQDGTRGAMIVDPDDVGEASLAPTMSASKYSNGHFNNTSIANEDDDAVNDDELHFVYNGVHTPASLSSRSSTCSFHSFQEELDGFDGEVGMANDECPACPELQVDLPDLAQDTGSSCGAPSNTGSPVTPFQPLHEVRTVVEGRDFIMQQVVHGNDGNAAYFDMWAATPMGRPISHGIGTFPRDDGNEGISRLARDEEEEEL